MMPFVRALIATPVAKRPYLFDWVLDQSFLSVKGELLGAFAGVVAVVV